VEVAAGGARRAAALLNCGSSLRPRVYQSQTYVRFGGPPGYEPRHVDQIR